MLTMDENRFWRETRGHNPVKRCPIARVNHVEVPRLEKASQLEYNPDAISAVLVHFMDDDRPFEAIDEFAALGQQTQFVNQMFRRSIDDVHNTVLETTGRK